MGTIHTDVLEKVVVFSTRSTALWSGRGKLTAEDLGAAAELLPPAALASLGSKRLFPREQIKKLEAFKRRLNRVIAVRGTPFLTGCAVPVSEAEDCARECNAVIAEANTFVEDLLAKFDATIKEWHEDNPAWKHVLAASTPERESVRRRIKFDYDAFPVGIPDGEGLAERMREAVGSLGSNMLGDIAREAAVFLKRSLSEGRSDGTQKTVNPMRRLIQKLNSLSFLDHNALPVVEVANLVLGTFPSKGRIQADHMLRLVRLAGLLSDPKKMRAAAQRVFDGTDTKVLASELAGIDVGDISGLATGAGDLGLSGSVAMPAVKTLSARDLFGEPDPEQSTLNGVAAQELSIQAEAVKEAVAAAEAPSQLQVAPQTVAPASVVPPAAQKAYDGMRRLDF